MRGALSTVMVMVTLAFEGCSQKPIQPMRFDKPGGNQQDFMQDRFACVQQAQQGRSGGYVNQYGGSTYGTVITSRGVFLACMGAKGYGVSENGPLFAPPGSEIQMTN